MDKETLEMLLDKLEEGQFCNCLVDTDKDVRLFKEQPHFVNCIGKVKVGEIIYEIQFRQGSSGHSETP